jgi:hypothetical protein
MISLLIYRLSRSSNLAQGELTNPGHPWRIWQAKGLLWKEISKEK